MNDTNKYGIYEIQFDHKDRPSQHSFLALAENKQVAEYIVEALNIVHGGEGLEYLLAIDYPLQDEKTFTTTNSSPNLS
jgi:hypothetical protein